MNHKKTLSHEPPYPELDDPGSAARALRNGVNKSGKIERYENGAPPSNAPIFIVGMPRSGTTLLSAMLSAHPRIAIAPETHFLSHEWRLQRNLTLSDKGHFDAVWARFVNGKRYADLGLSEKKVLEWFYKKDDLSFKGLFASILECYAADKGKPRAGEKTPGHYLHIDIMLEWFPDARIIFMFRDPRAVVASLLVAPFGNPYPWFHGKRWEQAYQEFRRSEADPRVMAVRYEDLVCHTQKTLMTISAFLGEEYSENMIVGRCDNTSKSRGGWHAQHIGAVNKPVSRESVSKWRNELSCKERAMIEIYTRNSMVALGYEPHQHKTGVKASVCFVFDYLIGRMNIALQSALIRRSHKFHNKNLNFKDKMLQFLGDMSVEISHFQQFLSSRFDALLCLMSDRMGCVVSKKKRWDQQLVVAVVGVDQCTTKRKVILEPLQELFASAQLIDACSGVPSIGTIIVCGDISANCAATYQMLREHVSNGGKIVPIFLSLDSVDESSAIEIIERLKLRDWLDHSYVVGYHTQRILNKLNLRAEVIGPLSLKRAKVIDGSKKDSEESLGVGVEIVANRLENPFNCALEELDEILGLCTRELVQQGRVVRFIARNSASRIRARRILQAFHLAGRVLIDAKSSANVEPYNVLCVQSAEMARRAATSAVPFVSVSRSFAILDMLSAYDMEDLSFDIGKASGAALARRLTAVENQRVALGRKLDDAMVAINKKQNTLIKEILLGIDKIEDRTESLIAIR